MKYLAPYLVAVLFFFYSLQSAGQKATDDVLVTGDVVEVIFCRHEDDYWLYSLKIKLHAKNISDHPVIIPSGDANVDYYKTANTLEELKTKTFGSFTRYTNSSGDPKSVPDSPIILFRILAPNTSIDINTSLDLFLFSDPKPGPILLQVVAENWPDYSKEYIAKIREAWKSSGSLWFHTFRPEPISFEFPKNFKEGLCL